MIDYSNLMIKVGRCTKTYPLTPLMIKYLKLGEINKYLVPSLFEIPFEISMQEVKRRIIQSISKNELMRAGVSDKLDCLKIYEISKEYRVPVIDLKENELPFILNNIYKYMVNNMFNNSVINTGLVLLKGRKITYLLLIANHVFQDNAFTAEDIIKGNNSISRYKHVINYINDNLKKFDKIDMTEYIVQKGRWIEEYQGIKIESKSYTFNTKIFFKRINFGIFYPLLFAIQKSLFCVFQTESIPMCIMKGRPKFNGIFEIYGDFHDEILVLLKNRNNFFQFKNVIEANTKSPFITLESYNLQDKTFNSFIEPVIVNINFATNKFNTLNNSKKLFPLVLKNYIISIKAMVSFDMATTTLFIYNSEKVNSQMKQFEHALGNIINSK